ncbi:MAG: hypothetical protein RML46_03950 [Anaerolineae bacterium]|nr:S1 family peptidase [Anaerolineae bacterium]MDW8068045.1 hypothetical protein [Anaerolineae bacterium]
MESYIAQIAALKQRYLPDLLSRRNVVGCGIGYKVREGVQTRELSLVVSVTHKVHPSALTPEDLIPAQMEGIPTDVVELGVLRAFSGPRDRWRPGVPPGVSVGHIRISAGTLGCLVRRGSDLFILSNNHVLADTNKGRAGDPILQPGPADGGTADDAIATLEAFVPLDFGTAEPECPMATLLANGLNALAALLGSRHRLEPVRQTLGVNRVDAALARPLRADLVRPDILGIGIPTGIGEAILGLPVQKSGRTTGHTTGVITQIDATVRIDYYGPSALFEGQLVASSMSQPGDSGAAVLDLDRRVVGLLFAGSDAATIINPIADVLTALRIELVTA